MLKYDYCDIKKKVQSFLLPAQLIVLKKLFN